ncbi:MAG: response regulator [Phycisphaerales bacterium]
MRLLRRAPVSLKVKGTLGVLAVMLLAVGVVAWMDVWRSESASREALRGSADSFAASLAVACELPIAVGDTGELDRLAARFVEIDDQIAFIAIYDHAGAMLTGSSRDPAAWAHYLSHDERPADYILGRAAVHPIGSFDMMDLHAESELADATPDKGQIVVGVSMRRTRAMHLERQKAAAATTLVAVLISIALVTALVGHWTQRLSKLVRASERISSGDFSEDLHDDRPDEIGTLVRSFEKMRRAIDERNRFEQERREELDRARASAERANAAKSQFLAHMSHEIRTPLNGVVGMLDLLEQTTLDGKQKRFVAVGRTSADALLDIINCILDFSKIEAGQLTLESIEFDVHEVIETVVEILAPKGQAKGLEMVCFIGKDVPRVAIGDPSRLRQIVLNLLTNAIKFTEHGEVVVRASLVAEGANHHTLKFTVSDTGIGIPLESRGRLFKSFSQVDASTTRRFGGTGLGLAICKNLAEMMGGTIGVDESRTIGSEFWFTVRLRRCGSPAKPRSLETPIPQLVLIVDDNQTNREILVEALRNWKAHPYAVAHAHDALRALREAQAAGNPYTLAIIDMQMPDMDGAQLAEAIRSDPGIDAPAMLMLSSMYESALPPNLDKLGIQACLSKPVKLSTLFETISRVCGNLEYAASPRPEPRDPGTDARCLRGARVLVAEDNTVNQIVITELLRQHEIEVEMADNGRVAVERWEGSRFDAILMDCEMPVMDGLLATRTIREREAACPSGEATHTPIIALTANAIQGDRERCIEAGMDDYLTKPIVPGDLVAALVRHGVRGRPDPEAPTPRHATDPGHHPAPAPEPRATASPSSIDAEGALARCGGSPAILGRVFEEYVKSATRHLEELDEHAARAELDELARIAHGLKGASANIGAKRASELASALELAGRSGDAAALDERIESLRAEMAQVIEEVNQARGQLAEQGSERR